MSGRNVLNRQELGAKAEEMAREYLVSRGLSVLIQNFRCRTGELDLVALDGSTLVVVEVRFRSGSRYADAAASVVARKQLRITRATRFLLMKEARLARYPIRFDVVAIDAKSADQAPTIRWIRGAFRVR